MLVLLLLYFYFSASCLTAHSQLLVIEQDWIFHPDNEIKLLETLNALINDTNYCSYCVDYFEDFTGLKKLVKQQEIQSKLNQPMRTVRIWLNILSVMNSIVVFLFFGGPTLITVVCFLSYACVLISLFLTNPKQALYLEFSVLIVTAVLLFNAIHALVVTIAEIKLAESEINAETALKKND